MMSGFHAMWSVGGILGAGGVTLLLWAGAAPVVAALAGSGLALAALLVATPRFLRAAGGAPPTLALPKGIVLVLAVLTAITFLVEGAVLDWGALLIVAQGLLDATAAGTGYLLFSVAMTVARLTGDRIVAALGQRLVLLLRDGGDARHRPDAGARIGGAGADRIFRDPAGKSCRARVWRAFPQG